MRVDTDHALGAGAMEVYTDLLTHSIDTIRAKAARDIMDLSVPLAGKNKAVEVRALPALVTLLQDKATDGMKNAIRSGAIKDLVGLVNDDNSEVRLNALKAITCLSEAPEGRRNLLHHVEQIRSRTSIDLEKSEAVRRAAEIAVKVITWKP